MHTMDYSDFESASDYHLYLSERNNRTALKKGAIILSSSFEWKYFPDMKGHIFQGRYFKNKTSVNVLKQIHEDFTDLVEIMHRKDSECK